VHYNTIFSQVNEFIPRHDFDNHTNIHHFGKNSFRTIAGGIHGKNENSHSSFTKHHIQSSSIEPIKLRSLIDNKRTLPLMRN